jgi:hypothetical protein
MDIAGSVCGDPLATPWRVTFTEGPTAVPETASPVFKTANPAKIGSVIYQLNGAEVARVDFSLHFFAGTGPTMTLEATPSGPVSNLTINTPVTATPVASCP